MNQVQSALYGSAAIVAGGAAGGILDGVMKIVMGDLAAKYSGASGAVPSAIAALFEGAMGVMVADLISSKLSGEQNLLFLIGMVNNLSAVDMLGDNIANSIVGKL